MSADPARGSRPAEPPLESLYECEGLPYAELPPALARLYGGAGFGLPPDCVYANFVASVDGVVALPGDLESGQVISGRNLADRFVMGLLRAFADAVVIGAGTFRRSPGHLWRAERIYPPAASSYAEVRRRTAASAAPTLVVVSATGALDPAQPALEGAWIMTSAQGAGKLRGKLPESARLMAFETPRLDSAVVVRELRRAGFRRILTEGGPAFFAQLIEARLVDQLFLTSAPSLFGRFPADQRSALAEGLDLSGQKLALLSLRRHASHLFLRYALER